MSETTLEMAKRHVEQAERAVEDQRARIARLDQDGHDTTMARAVLETFETTLRVARSDLALLGG